MLPVQPVVKQSVVGVLLELLLLHPERRLDLLKGFHEVVSANPEVLDVNRLGHVVDIDLPVHRVGGGADHKAPDLRPAEVFGPLRKLFQIDVGLQVTCFADLHCVNLEDLQPALLVRKTNLDQNLEAARPQQGLVQEVLAVGHPNQQHVVQGLHSVDLGQKLIHHTVRDSCAIPGAATGLADGVNLVENDQVQLTFVALLLHFSLRIFEEVPNVLLGLADVLVQDLRSIHNLWLFALQHLSDLPCHQSLPRAGRSVQQDTFDMFQAHLSDDRGGKEPRREGPAEDRRELLVEPTDAELLEVKVLLKELCGTRGR
eukprot:RCo052359